MTLKPIKEIVDNLSDTGSKRLLGEKLNALQDEIDKLNAKYLKSNEDKLTLSHLLSKVNKELEESLRNEKKFIASVSHELRTPLTAILGYSELLDDTTLNNKQKRYLSNIVQSSNHLLALISDLLDVSKLEDNRIELSLKEFDLDDTLTECANLIRSKIPEGVQLITDIPLMEYPVIADEKRIKQIFINLLSNAAKFTKKGSIRFYVENMTELENKKIKFTINIDDSGSGIPEKIADKLFDPFQSTDKTQGTGLGLYISQRLANLMGGEITVKSKMGVGSSFSVTIVLDRAKKKEFGKGLNGANIMMFSKRDDFVDKISKELVGYGANFHNYDISSADTASALVQMIASGKFYDIAIFDMDIFKNNTASIAGTLKVVNQNIKLVALSDTDEEYNLFRFEKIIQKPVSYQHFLKTIENIYTKEYFGEEEEVDYSNLNILIVEDVELNMEYEKEMLKNFFSILSDTAANGKEAVEKARKNKYDAILMDMRMPVMDGLEATRKIREFDQNTPIICMSANVYKEDKLAAEEAGMNDFIEKPLDRKDIESKLLKLVNNEFSSISEKRTGRESDPAREGDADSMSAAELKSVAIGHLSSNFDSETAKRLFAKAIESIADSLKKIDKHFKAKNVPELLEDYHVLKGICSNMGLMSLADKAGALQHMAEEGSLLPLLKPTEELVSSLKSLVKEA